MNDEMTTGATLPSCPRCRDVNAVLPTLAGYLQGLLTRLAGEPVGLSLVVWTGSCRNSVSNASAEDTVRTLRAIADKLEAAGPHPAAFH